MQIKKFFISDFLIDDSGEFSGYISVFNGVDSYGDTIAPQAYDFVLEEIAAGRMPMPKMFFNHDRWGIPIGVWLELAKDEKGIKARGRLNLNIQKGREIYEAMRFGSVDGLSVCIEIPESEYDVFSENRTINNIVGMDEVSVVTFPADDKARIFDIKSAVSSYNSLKDVERLLRDVAPTMSKTDACAVISAIKRIAKTETETQSDFAARSGLNAIKNRIFEIVKK